MKSEQMEKIGVFLRHIYCNNISVLFSEFDKTKQIDSISKFAKILREKAGRNFSCVLDKHNNKVLIYDDYCKEYIGFLCGTVDYGYFRGDVHESILHIKYAVIEDYVYIGGERVAYVCSLDQITVRQDGIYIIDKITKSLMKYSNNKLQWKTDIPVNSTQCYKFCLHMDNLGEPYPRGVLIAIYDSLNLYHFYCESGTFYGHTRVKKQYEMI